MRKSIVYLLLIVCTFFAFVSCESEQETTGSLRICFGDESKRVFAPDATGEVPIDYYEVKLTLSDGKIYEAKNIRSTTLELKDLPIGETHITVSGYKDDNPNLYAARGTTIFRLYVSDNSVTVPLIYNGKGSFVCDGAFDINKLDESDGKISFRAEILNPTTLTSTEIIPSRRSLKNQRYRVEYDSLNAGIYLYRCSIVKNGKVLAQHTEAFKIVPGQQTFGEFTFDLGGTVENLSVNVVPIDQNVPIEGQIKYVGKDLGGVKDVYEIEVTKKPDYIKDKEMRYRWVLNGTEKVEGKTITIGKENAINDRVYLTAIITGSAQYMMGTATMTVHYDRTFANSNPDFTLKQ